MKGMNEGHRQPLYVRSTRHEHFFRGSSALSCPEQRVTAGDIDEGSRALAEKAPTRNCNGTGDSVRESRLLRCCKLYSSRRDAQILGRF